MRLLRRLLSRIWNSAASRRGDERLREEMEQHVALQTEENIRTGMPAIEARRRALIKLGAIEAIREDYHAEEGLPIVEAPIQDCRIALRVLRRSPGFSTIAVITLGLAIGANGVVFSVLNALVLQPLRLPEAQDLFMIQRGQAPSQSYPDYVELRDRNQSFDALISYEMDPAGLDANGSTSPIWLYEASGNYFDALGIRPYLGRFFRGSDEHGPNSAPYLVLSYAYWQSHFHGDPDVVGRGVELNKYPYTILGVAPPRFRGTELFYSPDLWVPIVDDQQVEGYSGLTSRSERGLWVVGHLKQGISPAQARADLGSVAAYLSRTYPKDDAGIQFSLARPGLVGDMLGGPVRMFMSALMLLTGLILLAACANLGSLFAARAADRSKEVAVRLALGSSRLRILRQLLTEATFLSLIGGSLGLIGAVALLRLLSNWRPIPNIPINLPVNPDGRTYWVALLLSIASGLLFGIVPIRQVLRADPWQNIKLGKSGDAGKRRLTGRDLLVSLQIAICAVLVTSALVGVRGLIRSLHSNFGFLPEHTLQVSTDLDMAGYSGAGVSVMQRRMLNAVEAIPGVSAAGYANRIPLNLGWSNSDVYSDSTTSYDPSHIALSAMDYSVSPGYFRAAGTSLLSGRSFTWHDDGKAVRVAVVNEEFARRLFGSASKALGAYFKIWGGTRVEVVGVAENGKYMSLAESPQPAMFLPILQAPSSTTDIIVRSNRDPGDLAPAIDRVLRGLDAGLPFTIDTWQKELDTALFAPRAATAALGVLGVLGALLALTGIFGISAYSVSRRLRELGIRIALGATQRQVLSAALGRIFRLLLLGSLAGLGLGVAASRLLSFIVYQATPRDPAVLGGFVAIMVALGIIAAWVPAHRALSADILLLLREE